VEIVLETGVGPVPIRLDRDGPRIVFGRMSQPVPTVEPFPAAAALLAGLGVGRSELPVELYVNGPRHVFVALPSEAAVAGLRPDFGAVARAAEATVNCFAGAGRRWKTRAFAPAFGISEDPATGSAAGPLACHLVRHRRLAPGEELEIAQGRDPPPEHAVRPRRGRARPDHEGGGRRLRGRRRPRGVPPAGLTAGRGPLGRPTGVAAGSARLNLVDAAEPLRVRIPASGGLKRESDAPIDQLRAIDNRRLARGPLARLPDAPVRRVEAAILEVLEIVERDGDGPQRPG
jgi:hypothetical protein